MDLLAASAGFQGAVLYVAGQAATIADGFALARATIAAGRAQAALDRLITLSHTP